jgi:hypothetical protein
MRGRHLSIFFYDEWSIVIKRQGGSLGTYLDPHGGHFILFIVVVYKLLFAIFGLRHYIVFRFVGVLMQLACATLLYLLARRRIGAWWALLPTTMLLFMGTAGEDLLWPFQIGFFASLAGARSRRWCCSSVTRAAPTSARASRWRSGSPVPASASPGSLRSPSIWPSQPTASAGGSWESRLRCSCSGISPTAARKP